MKVEYRSFASFTMPNESYVKQLYKEDPSACKADLHGKENGRIPRKESRTEQALSNSQGSKEVFRVCKRWAREGEEGAFRRPSDVH